MRVFRHPFTNWLSASFEHSASSPQHLFPYYPIMLQCHSHQQPTLNSLYCFPPPLHPLHSISNRFSQCRNSSPPIPDFSHPPDLVTPTSLPFPLPYFPSLVSAARTSIAIWPFATGNGPPLSSSSCISPRQTSIFLRIPQISHDSVRSIGLFRGMITHC